MAVATPLKPHGAVTADSAAKSGTTARDVRPRDVEIERHSLAAILDLLRTGQAATRLELEKASSLGRAVVLDRVASLTRLGLVEAGEAAPSMGGRAPRTIRFRADAGLILVAAFDRSSIGIGLADLAGRMAFEHHEAADLADGPEAIIARLDTLIDWVLDQHEDRRALWGIGIGIPGMVETQPGGAFALQRLHLGAAWSDSLAIERLIVRHRAPVWVRSTFQMAAIGELGPSRPDRQHSILFADLGAELSAGLAVEGRLQPGAQGVAGQLGHIWAGEAAARTVCRCGNTGCLETVAGSDAVVRAATEAAISGGSRRLADTLAAKGEVTVADVGLAAQLGDAVSAQLLARCGQLVGATLAALVNALNPSSVVLGGELAQTGDILLAAVREAIYRHSHPLATRDLRIVRSNMGRSAGLAGAALIAADALFRPEVLGEWIGLGTPVRHPAMAGLLAQATAALGGQPASHSAG